MVLSSIPSKHEFSWDYWGLPVEPLGFNSDGLDGPYTDGLYIYKDQKYNL